LGVVVVSRDEKLDIEVADILTRLDKLGISLPDGLTLPPSVYAAKDRLETFRERGGNRAMRRQTKHPK